MVVSAGITIIIPDSSAWISWTALCLAIYFITALPALGATLTITGSINE